MAFFDDLGKKITQASQSAVQKTKDFTGVAKINGLISDEEKNINNNYFQIGKLYVAMHQDNYEDDFSGMINSIRESEAKIKDYKQQIQNIKGVVHCEKCGAEVAANVAFCSTCGAAMPQQIQQAPANPDLIKCSGCGAMVNKNMRFCTSCGKPMAETRAPVVEKNDTPVVNTQPEPQSEAQIFVEPAVEVDKTDTEPELRFCTNCGVRLEEDVLFCTTCGCKVE